MARINTLTFILLAIIIVMNGRVQVKAFRVDMQRVWSRNMTNAVHRSNARLKRLETAIRGKASHTTDLGAPVKSVQSAGEFMMTMGFSLPDITFHLEGGADYVVEGKYNFLLDPESGSPASRTLGLLSVIVFFLFPVIILTFPF
ncbi:hypothetical protein SUGI_0337680 [Cryptomeria japonica]|nr:hypothetical protein SUGI_0337680 [Cryptomeria japonica]